MEQPDLNEIYTKFAAHEVQCEERWKTIFSRLERMDAKMDRLQNQHPFPKNLLNSYYIFLGIYDQND